MPQHNYLDNLTVSISKLHRMVQEYTQQMIDQESDRNLHVSFEAILLPLLEREGQTLSEISGRLHMKPPTVTVIANRLEDLGWIRRERGKTDRRQVHLYLTKTGCKKAEKLTGIKEKVAKRLTQGLKKDSLISVNDTLTTILENLSDKLGNR